MQTSTIAKGSTIMLRQKVTPEAQAKHAADVALAAKFDDLLSAARDADSELREAEVRRAGVTEIHRLAKNLDAALTDAMHAAYAVQRAAIGPLGYDDRIYARKAKARPEIHKLTAEAERLLTLRENHRMNRIPEVPREPAVLPAPFGEVVPVEADRDVVRYWSSLAGE